MAHSMHFKAVCVYAVWSAYYSHYRYLLASSCSVQCFCCFKSVRHWILGRIDLRNPLGIKLIKSEFIAGSLIFFHRGSLYPTLKPHIKMLFITLPYDLQRSWFLTIFLIQTNHFLLFGIFTYLYLNSKKSFDAKMNILTSSGLKIYIKFPNPKKYLFSGMTKRQAKIEYTALGLTWKKHVDFVFAIFLS